MTETPSRPAGPARQAVAPPPRQGKPVELLPGAMKTRALEDVRTATPRMHPIQRRPAPPATED